MMDKLSRSWAAVPAKPFVFGYLALYALMLYLLARFESFDPSEPLSVLGILGVGFTFLAWLLTLGLPRIPLRLGKPAAEALAVTVYLLVFAFGFLGWGMSWLKAALPDPRAHMLAVTLAKLLTMVLLPALLLRRFGHPLKEQLRWNFGWRRLGWRLALLAAALMAFQALASGSLKDLSDLHASLPALLIGLPLCFVYLCVDTGLTEEFLFRVVVQTRFAALFRSETAGVVVMAVLFGLAHAPGYYLRAGDAAVGSHPSVLMAAGYAIVLVSVFGFMFGMLWARTRSLGLLVMAHAFTDLLPNTADFMQTWMGAAAPAP